MKTAKHSGKPKEFFFENSRKKITLETGIKFRTTFGRISYGTGFAVNYCNVGKIDTQYLIDFEWEKS